ncbi:pimeloyl-ACP methyl ester carboxylesterase [Streptomyces griseochromogenes]|uniref:Pimeloyl-ACP methyl ester carboxylesterase n=2 Tax=Streptomyces griseochromogenes TaxID=68214 RepID=A0ABS4LIM8_9ACTN|nr:alpha/beta hydrolase [Streptomyces griseochromogenes]MBP2047234.1 pimeloyl-ACP methyl ester carboxylesterase [Streptomyces griseochromogenes]
MKLHTREWGTGDRVAVLVHGIMSDHRTWHRVAPALADKGYRVIAVDLRGHGASGRGEYGAEIWADDLVETLPHGPQLAIGHSLGAMALALAAERLAPERVVYCDPAWELRRDLDLVARSFAEAKHVNRAVIEHFNPRWDAADVEIELSTLADWDPATAHALPEAYAVGRTPRRPVAPSLVLLADPSDLVSPELEGELTRRGFTARTVPGAGHSLYRDDFQGFMGALDGWI